MSVQAAQNGPQAIAALESLRKTRNDYRLEVLRNRREEERQEVGSTTMKAAFLERLLVLNS